MSPPPNASNLRDNGPYPYETREASAFGNVVVTVPGTVMGGQLKVSGFVGSNTVSVRLKSDSVHILDPNQSGTAYNNSLMAGGTALWAYQSMYLLGSVVGTFGQTTLKDSVDDCYTSPPYATDFCHGNRYNFNTAGFIGTLTAGKVFDLGGASGPKLDLRGSVSHTRTSSDSFRNVFGDQQTYTFSTWTGTAGATLFANMAMPDNGLLRPYLMGYVRQEWGYHNELDAVQSDGLVLGNFPFQQRHVYGGVDAGFTYVQGNTTIGAAVYFEGSGDERTIGGRLGMSQKLDDIMAPSRRFNWTGFYVGANAGGSWAESRTRTSTICLDVGPGGFADGTFTCPFTAPADIAAINAAGTRKLSDSGFTGGVQAGLNLPLGGVIFGLELEAGSFQLGGSSSVTAAPPGATVVAAFDTDWLLGARARIGLPLATNILLYGTGGFAMTDLSVRNSVTLVGANTTSGHVVGRTIGGGLEWALNRNWTLRGEYLHHDFGKVTTNAPVVGSLTDDFNSAGTTVDLTVQVVRGGLNYKF